MRLMTPAQAAAWLAQYDLQITAGQIKRRQRSGEYPGMVVGTHLMVDADRIREILEGHRSRPLMNTEELSEEIGLSPSAIRRGVKEGWMPVYQAVGRHLVFDLDAVLEALNNLMNDSKPGRD